MPSSNDNWCNTCFEECHDRGSICTTCGEELQSRPSTNSTHHDSLSNSNGSMGTNPAINVPVPVHGLNGVNNLNNLNNNPDLLNYLDSVANETQPTPSSTHRKATSKEFLKSIPRIIITQHSSLFYDVIVECTITPSSDNSDNSDNSNGSKAKSCTVLQFDAIAAEFGPSPPYTIQGTVSSFLDCETDMRAGSTSTSTSTTQWHNPTVSKSPPIAYMMRGKGISFVDRALYAQRNGSEALIIANHVSVWPYIMKDSKNALSRSSIPLRIPVVMIKQSDHTRLAPYFKEEEAAAAAPSSSQQKQDISCCIHAKNKHDNKDDDACIICCEPFQISETAMRLPFCFHTFHEKCALVWLNKHNTCPYCRRELPMEDREEEQQRRRTGRAYASSETVDTRSNGDSFYG